MSMETQRDALGKALQHLGLEFPKLIVLSPDVAPSTRSELFKKSFPDRFIATGIAEQNAVGLAAGLASWGYVPLVALYAVFAAGKAGDQIINGIAYPNLNVKIVGTHAGINVGADGPTHQSIHDLGVMRSIPNMTVLTAAGNSEVEPALREALQHPGPVYLRLERAPSPEVKGTEHPYRIGEGITVREGTDLAIVAIGSMVYESLTAAEALQQRNISALVINMRSLKPLDRPLLKRAAKETAGIITVEDHNRHGGLYSAVCEALAGEGHAPVRYVALEDTFAESGDYRALWSKYGLHSDRIVAVAWELLQKRMKGRA